MGDNGGLAGLRRTHYSRDLAKEAPERVTVMGWVSSVRAHGNIVFMGVRDRHGDMQIVAKRGSVPDEILDTIRELKPHSSVSVTGTLKRSDKAPGGVEIEPAEVRVFASVSKIPPFEPQAKTVKNIDTRLEVRPIDMRRKAAYHILRARSAALGAIRGYFADNDFTEVNTPKLIATATEGGAALFSIFFYNKEAFLAQSPQLYKEQLTMSFERVYEIAPIFRAEPSHTHRHLAETMSIDMEEAFVDYGDIMDRLEGLLRAAGRAVKLYASENPEGDLDVPDVPDQIPRYAYRDLLKRVQDAGAKAEFGDDLYPSDLKRIGIGGFYFITDWPLAPKPFYVKQAAEPDVSESFDLMYGDLELSSGSTRIQNRQEIMDRMEKKGMKTDSFSYHLDAFDYGMPPHAGAGMGLDRLMMALTNNENIRDVTFYPRDINRLTP